MKICAKHWGRDFTHKVWFTYGICSFIQKNESEDEGKNEWSSVRNLKLDSGPSGFAQWLEHRPEDIRVASSIPARLCFSVCLSSLPATHSLSRKKCPRGRIKNNKKTAGKDHLSIGKVSNNIIYVCNMHVECYLRHWDLWH